MFFSSNIRLLRGRRGQTQADLAAVLNIKRSKINAYENSVVRNPTLDALTAFSAYFRLSIDTLVKVDLSRLSEFKLLALERGHDDYAAGSKLRVLAHTVDRDNRENIEVVPLKAKAGYTSGYNDPGFISSLPTFQLPFLLHDRNYRAFQIDGDSMLPLPHGAWVIGEYVTDWREVKDGQACILLTMDEGIVFKVVYNQIRKRKNLLLKSLNPQYKPYEIVISEVKEIWRFVNFISKELPKPLNEGDEMAIIMHQIRENVEQIHQRIRVDKK